MIGWLNRVCALTDRYAPFSIEVNGDRWVCATDGYRLLAMRSDEPIPTDGAWTRPKDEVTLTIGRYIATSQKESSALTLPRSALLAWAGTPPDEPTPVTCAKCDGTGEIECSPCHGTGDCTCTCGHEHDCEECEGSGLVDCSCGTKRESLSDRMERRRRPGTVNGYAVDRTLFHELLAACPEGNVDVIPRAERSLDPLLLRAPGWVAGVMGLGREYADQGPDLAASA